MSTGKNDGRDDGFSAAEALRRLASAGVVGGGIVLANVVAGLSYPCPFLRIFGWQCPFCGATRSAKAIALGDLVAAWHYNPAFIVAAVIAVLAGLAWTVEVAGGPRIRPPGFLRPLTQTKVYAVLAVVLTVFTVLRNLNL